MFELIASFLGSALAIAIGIGARAFLTQRGKNLATKQDVGDITSKIEAVKVEYATQVESLKGSLSAQINTHSFRYQQEFEILRELSARLVDVRNTGLALRPAMDYQDPEEPEDARRHRRIVAFHTAFQGLLEYGEKNMPFYPSEVYEKIKFLRIAARKEQIAYQHLTIEVERFRKYWDTAEENQLAIQRCADEALNAVRDRVVRWDDLVDKRKPS